MNYRLYISVNDIVLEKAIRQCNEAVVTGKSKNLVECNAFCKLINVDYVVIQYPNKEDLKKLVNELAVNIKDTGMRMIVIVQDLEQARNDNYIMKLSQIGVNCFMTYDEAIKDERISPFNKYLENYPSVSTLNPKIKEPLTVDYFKDKKLRESLNSKSSNNTDAPQKGSTSNDRGTTADNIETVDIKNKENTEKRENKIKVSQKASKNLNDVSEKEKKKVSGSQKDNLSKNTNEKVEKSLAKDRSTELKAKIKEDDDKKSVNKKISVNSSKQSQKIVINTTDNRAKEEKKLTESLTKDAVDNNSETVKVKNKEKIEIKTSQKEKANSSVKTDDKNIDTEEKLSPKKSGKQNKVNKLKSDDKGQGNSEIKELSEVKKSSDNKNKNLKEKNTEKEITSNDSDKNVTSIPKVQEAHHDVSNEKKKVKPIVTGTKENSSIKDEKYNKEPVKKKIKPYENNNIKYEPTNEDLSEDNTKVVNPEKNNKDSDSKVNDNYQNKPQIIEKVEYKDVEIIGDALITFMSATSNGKSFLSWNLAHAFASRGHKVAYICLDGSNSAVEYFNLHDYESPFKNLTKKRIQDVLDEGVKINKNLTVFTGEFGKPTYLSNDVFTKILMRIKANYNIVIFDSATGYSDMLVNVLNYTNVVISVFDLDSGHYKLNINLYNTLKKFNNLNKNIAIVNNVFDQSKDLNKIISSLESLNVFKDIVHIRNCGATTYDYMCSDTCNYLYETNEFTKDFDALLRILRLKERGNKKKNILSSFFNRR